MEVIRCEEIDFLMVKAPEWIGAIARITNSRKAIMLVVCKGGVLNVKWKGNGKFYGSSLIFYRCGLRLNFQRACRKWLPFYFFVGMVHNTWTNCLEGDSCMKLDSYVGVDSNYFRGELPS